MQQLLAWWLFNIRGWRVEGKFHFELPKSIIIVAPHTHWVDFFIGLAVRKKLHFEFVHFLGKSELFLATTRLVFTLSGSLSCG